MKTFKNILPYETEAETLTGKMVKLTSKRLTPKESNILSEIIGDYKIPNGDKIMQQMALIFGNEIDYNEFDYNLLNKILLDYVDYLNEISKKK